MKNNFNILAATDYSPAAENAMRYAILLANETGSFITFLHVFGKGGNLPKEFIEIERIDETREDFEESKLEQYIEHLATSMSIELDELDYSFEVAEGNVTKAILTTAKEDKVDFIVVGTHGVSTLKEAFFGGHAWNAIKKEAIPILVIPPEASYLPLRKIVFTTEYRQSEIPLINYLSMYAAGFDAELIVLHITNNIFSPDFDHELYEKFKKNVQKEVRYDKLSMHLIKNAALIEGINKFCLQVKADWLVMSHEKTSFLVSVFNPVSFTKKMSFHTHIPLFAVPDGYVPAVEAKKPKRATHGDIRYGDFFA